MKRLLLSLFALFMLLSLQAVSVSPDQTAHPQFTLLAQESDNLEIGFSTPEYTLANSSLAAENYFSMQSDGSATLLEEGMPALPYWSTLVLLPNNGNVTLEIIGWDEERIPNTRVEPAGPLTMDGSSAPLALNDTFYSQRSEVYPAIPAMLGEPAVMRDIRIASLCIMPYAADPATGDLIVRSNIQVRVVTNPDVQGVNEITTTRKPSRSFQKLYESVLGYQRDDNEEYQQRSILVIYKSNSTLETTVASFVDWKRSKGFYIQAVTTTTTGTSYANIKNYITTCYNNWENPPEYVVIIGDPVSGSLTVPTYIEGDSGYGGETDHYYTTLVGSDMLPELFVGRISITTTTQMAVYWSKIVNYEIQPYTTSTTWYENTLLISDYYNSGISTYITNQSLRDMLEVYDPDMQFTEITGYSPSVSSITNAINTGKVLVSYRGIGGLGGWSPSNITSLTNTYKLSNAIIITCDTGSFASTTSGGVDPCRTEAWIRAGTSTAPTGGINAIGMATNGTHTCFNNALHGGITYGMFAQDMPTMGEALMRGKLNIYETYNNFSTTFTKSFMYWCNLMGDPTVDVWKMLPETITASHPASLAEGVNQMEVSVTDSNGTPVEEAWVTVRQTDASDNETCFASGYTDAAGYVLLTFTPPDQGTLGLVITKPQCFPIIEDIDITDGGVAYEAVVITDNGNNDGQADSGEDVTLGVTLRNYGDASCANVTATISCEDDYITITSANDTFGTIASGSTGSGSNGMVIHVAEDCPDGRTVYCMLLVQSGADEWTSCFELVIQGGDLDIAGTQVYDNGNGVLDPSETAALRLQLANDGQHALQNVSAQLTTTSTLVTISDDTASWGTLTVGSSAWCSTDDFTVSALPQLLPGMTVPFSIHITADDGYIEDVAFELSIGSVTVSDPLGPDGGGYVCFDSYDVDYDDCPTYSWIECDPDHSGSGVNTGIVDSGENYDDVVYVALPFTFTFYGVSYDHATICSNGWLSFLETNQATFRNFKIPGPMGPSAMIAVFWDDLITSSGGVYTLYDENEHYYVIEWSDMRNTYNNSYEIFEVILYDPAYYPLSNGNGMIKMQYKDFNNVDQGSTSHYYPEHGAYSTIGLEDHTGLVGLQYTFSNVYPTAAHTLADYTAILFTSVPTIQEETQVFLANVQVNGEEESNVPHGSEVTLDLQLQNIGNADATNVHATLSCASPQVTLTEAESDWDDLAAFGTGWNTNDFEFTLSNWCPDQTTLPFTLDVTADQGTWSLTFDLTAVAPEYSVQQYYLEDTDGNGWLAPGEAASLDVWMRNDGHMAGTNLSAWLTCSQEWVDVNQGSATMESLEAGGNGGLSTPFGFSLRDDAPNPGVFWLDLAVQDSSGIYTIEQIEMNVGFRDEMENGEGEWTHYALYSTVDEWALSSVRYNTPSHSWKCGGTSSYQGNELTALESSDIEVGENAWLSFYHWMYAETSSSYPGYAFDGGYVQILWNDEWLSITPEGGYPYLSRGSSSTFDPETPIYSGQFGWERAWFDLSDYEGTVRFRFVFGADNGTEYEGWYIDDIAITTPQGSLLPPTDLFAVNPGDDNVILTWSAPTTAPTEYNVYRRLSLDTSYTLLSTVADTTFCDDEPAWPMQYYVVSAVYDQLESCFSNSAQAATSFVGVGDPTDIVRTALRGNFPNPFNPVTTINYSLASAGYVELVVYNIRGQRVRTLVNENVAAGEQSVVWDGSDENNRACSSGVYFCSLRAEGKNITHKMLLLK